MHDTYNISCAGSIRYLDLSGNAITDVGACQLADALRQCKIAFLDLEENSIGDTGARVLFESPRRYEPYSLGIQCQIGHAVSVEVYFF